jgi:hypothetical protein
VIASMCMKRYNIGEVYDHLFPLQLAALDQLYTPMAHKDAKSSFHGMKP